MTDEAPIKTMLLYSHIDRIWNELREVGYDDTTAKVIPVELLNKFDCLNYGGAGGAARSVAVLGLDSSQRVLDVGAGLGGPARCVSAVSGAQVTGIELQVLSSIIYIHTPSTYGFKLHANGSRISLSWGIRCRRNAA